MSEETSRDPNPEAPSAAVDYQEGGIVSRPLLKTPAGSLIVFAFDRGQSLSEHTVPNEAMIQVLEGEAEVRIDGRPHLVATGQMIRLPANRPHAVMAPDRFKMLLTMFRA